MNPTVLSSPVTPKPTKKSAIGKVQVIKKLGKSKFSVYLASSSDKKNYAMKVYPFEKQEMNKGFTQESRFTWLRHPNVISIVDSQPQIIESNSTSKISYILMEYCPHGDLAELVMAEKFPRDEKLVRTYFHQIVNGLEYLHSNGVAHLDLKLENLLLGENFQLKITDFDCAYIKNDLYYLGKGTANFRAPEIIQGKCRRPKAADIYSLGMMLFIMMSGSLAYLEDNKVKGHDLYAMVLSENENFWKIHAACTDSDVIENEDFKKLFWSMVRADPAKRATIDEIKRSKWYQGTLYSEAEVKAIMTKVFKSL